MSSDESNIKKIQGCNIPSGCQTVTAVKTVTPDIARVGDTVSYMITLKNDMNYRIEDILVRDYLPTGLQIVAGSIRVDGIKAIGDLSSGIEINQIQPKNKSVITFDASVISTEINPKINVAEVSYTTVVGSIPIPGKATTNPAVLDIVGTKISKTVTPNIATSGDLLTISITVTALADSTQNIITDLLPQELELVDNKITVGGTVLTGDITEGVDIGPILKGQSKTAVFKVRVQ